MEFINSKIAALKAALEYWEDDFDETKMPPFGDTPITKEEYEALRDEHIKKCEQKIYELTEFKNETHQKFTEIWGEED